MGKNDPWNWRFLPCSYDITGATFQSYSLVNSKPIFAHSSSSTCLNSSNDSTNLHVDNAFFWGFIIKQPTSIKKRITNSLQTLKSIVLSCPSRSRHPVLPENDPRHRLPGVHWHRAPKMKQRQKGVLYPLPSPNLAKNPLGRLQLH